MSRDCRTASKCGHCRGRHHSSIFTRMHKTRPQNGEEEHLQSSSSEKNSLLAHSESRLNSECAPFWPPDSSATLHASNRNEVLLQVARAFVLTLMSLLREFRFMSYLILGVGVHMLLMMYVMVCV